MNPVEYKFWPVQDCPGSLAFRPRSSSLTSCPPCTRAVQGCRQPLPIDFAGTEHAIQRTGLANLASKSCTMEGMAEPTNHELSERIAVLEERMKTLQSDLQGTLERFRADMADWKTDMAKRENRLLIAILGGIAVATAVLGVLIAGIPAA